LREEAKGSALRVAVHHVGQFIAGGLLCGHRQASVLILFDYAFGCLSSPALGNPYTASRLGTHPAPYIAYGFSLARCSQPASITSSSS
jgi:hypothetical protein